MISRNINKFEILIISASFLKLPEGELIHVFVERKKDRLLE